MYKKNNLVRFTGNKHYLTSTDNSKGSTVLPGIARVFNIANENDIHPYHIIAEPWGVSDVYGWVNKKEVTDISAKDAIQYLSYLKIINSPDYWYRIIDSNTIKYLDKLLINSIQHIYSLTNNNLSLSEAIDKLITAKIINTPEYWRQYSIKYDNIAALIVKLAVNISIPPVEKKENDDRRVDFIRTAQSFLGCNEWDGSHKEIIDIYNNYGNLPQGYKVQYYDSWCCTFVSTMAIVCGLADTVIPRECSCERHINLCKKMGIYVEDDNYMPAPGDIVYYTWDGSEYYDNTEFADHVGIVVSTITEDEILVIEGNKNDQVAYRTIWRNYPYIRGYSVPKF